MIAWIGKYLPAVEKQINRARNWNWLFGGWGTGAIVTWILASLGALWGFVNAKAEGQSVTVIVAVTVGLFAGVLLVAYLLARLWSLRRTVSSPAAAPVATGATTEPPLVMEFGTSPGFDDIDPHAGEATHRVVSLALRNTTDRFITDVAVRFRSIVPKPCTSVYQPGALLKEGIDVPPGQRRFVKLTYYDEVFPSGYVSPKIGLCTPPAQSS